MPALPDSNIRYEAQDGTVFSYSAKTLVDSDGMFSVVIEDQLVPSANKLYDRGMIKVSHGKTRVVAPKLSEAIAFIRACAADYLDCKKITSRVIVYSTELSVSFWKNGKDIYPNGSHDHGCGKDKGSWWTPKDGRDTHASKKHFSVGFGAAVYDKTVFKRKSGDVVTWEYVRDEEGPVCLLNSFVRLDMNPENGGNFKEMPYTDEAATYFHGVLITLCRMAESIDNFLEDEKKLQQAIESKKQFLLGAL